MIAEFYFNFPVTEHFSPTLSRGVGLFLNETFLVLHHCNSQVLTSPERGQILFYKAKAQSRQEVFLEVLIHKGVYNRIANGIGESNDMNYSEDHLNGHIVILLFKITWRPETNRL